MSQYWRNKKESFQVEVGGKSSNNSKRQLKNIIGSERTGLEVFQVESACRVEEEWEVKTLKLLYRGEKPLRIRSLIWRLELPVQSRTCEVLAPGYAPGMLEPYDLHRKLEAYRKEELLTLRGDLIPAELPGIAGVYDTQEKRAYLAWNRNETFLSELTAFFREGSRLVREEAIHCPCILHPGDELDFGSFYTGDIRGTREEAVRKITGAMWTKKEGRNEKLRIREVTIGARQLRSPYSEYADLFRKLPDIQKQGYNALMLTPYFPWPGWAVHDLMDADVTYHSLEGLKELSRRLHERKMKLILEIPQRGVSEYDTDRVDLPESPILNRLELYGYHETGHIARTYLRAFDFASEAYQNYLTEALLYYCREVQADGFLLDAQMWNAFPNWQPHGENRPYDSIPAGIGMMGNVREKVCGEFPDVFFIGQSGGPWAAGLHDYTVAYPAHWARWGLAPLVDKRETLKCFHNYICENTLSWDDYLEWYQEYAAALPEGTNLVTGPDTGKSTEWMMALGSQFDREIFGREAHLRMLKAALELGQSIQVYEGADTGLEEEYGELLKNHAEV
ncbi:MAG: hypothetical protein Q4F41_01720 [Eubacteriales bacterium]|nr:hypothetical protein [Eubacteriales bacterium]